MSGSDQFALIEHRLANIEGTHSDLKEAIRDLTQAIHKLAVIDERQVQSAVAVDKLSSTIDKAHTRIDSLSSRVVEVAEKMRTDSETKQAALEKRLVELEKAEPMQKQTSQWVFGALWGLAGLAGSYAFNKITKAP